MTPTIPADAPAQIAALLAEDDLTKMSLKQVRRLLEEQWKLAVGTLDAFSDKIKALTIIEIARIKEADFSKDLTQDTADEKEHHTQKCARQIDPAAGKIRTCILYPN